MHRNPYKVLNKIGLVSLDVYFVQLRFYGCCHLCFCTEICYRKNSKSENIFVVKYIRRVVIRKVFDKRYTYLYYGRAYNKA